ncbi:hypothetical protein Mapa_018556 [Marchantia paleacea]|nr:hypothetical protein Mapa_018556 [Marchantia paleacea]
MVHYCLLAIRIVERCPELEEVAARPLGDIIRTMQNLEAFHALGRGMSMTHWDQVAKALTWTGVHNLTKRMVHYFLLEIPRTLNLLGTCKKIERNFFSSVIQVDSKLKLLNANGQTLHQESEELFLSPELEEREDDGIQNSGKTPVVEGSITGGPKECPLGRFIASRS